LIDDRSALLEAIAEVIGDYRPGEVVAPSPEHVDRWISQFESGVQIPLLHELRHVFDSTYFRKDDICAFLGRLVTNPKLAGDDPAGFWSGVNFLDIQADGESQRAFLSLFDTQLNDAVGLRVSDCGIDGGPYVYLDDILFSGSRIGNDLSRWIADTAPEDATVHVLVIATHALGAWQMETRLGQDAAAAGKSIKVRVWRGVSFENRKTYRDQSEVLWPVDLPDDPQVKAYVSSEAKFPFEPRKPGGTLENPIFSSEDGRQLLEREFLVAGVRIRAACRDPSSAMRPLGFSPFGVGFGSMLVTYRNCPNNSPLALWWGEPDAAAGSALDWYPLTARKTYG
jgi:hypothetical protein